jgi:hypothetical protein
MKILTVVCENVVDVVPEVVKWNSWDGEHLRTVHSAYEQPQMLMSRLGEGLFVDRFKIPALGIRLKSMVYTTQWDDRTQISFTITPFFIAKNAIELIQLDKKRTKVKVTYQFSGGFFQGLLFPIFKIMIQKWNKQVWLEDLPLKLRRQKALDYGFLDFHGLPFEISNRLDRSIDYKCEIPVAKTKGIIEDTHPFYIAK